MTTNISKVGKLTYDHEQIIGKGVHCSLVFSGFFQGKSIGIRKPVAVKRPLLSRDDCGVQQEVAIIQKASGHPNILRFICTEIDGDFLYLATELCRGTLVHYIHGPYDGPEFTSDMEMIHQMIRGLAYLHGLKIVHGSMQPSHILIFVPEGRNDGPQIKLAGFGLSRLVIDDGSVDDLADCPDETESIVEREWIAPEINGELSNNRCDFRGDIWALGCVFGYTLCGGKHPYGEDPLDRPCFIEDKMPMLMVQENLKRPYTKDVEAFQLIKSMLEVEPATRPTAEDAQESILLLLKKYDFKTIKDRTQWFLDLCRSFSESDDEKLAQFEEFVKDGSVDVDAKMGFGETPLAWFCKLYRSSNLIDLVKILIENGADVKVQNHLRVTPLHHLCVNYKHDNLLDLIKLFKQKGAVLDAWTKSRESPLRLICENYKHENLMDVVKLLIDNKADLSLKAKDGLSAADILLKRGVTL